MVHLSSSVDYSILNLGSHFRYQIFDIVHSELDKGFAHKNKDLGKSIILVWEKGQKVF